MCCGSGPRNSNNNNNNNNKRQKKKKKKKNLCRTDSPLARSIKWIRFPPPPTTSLLKQLAHGPKASEMWGPIPRVYTAEQGGDTCQVRAGPALSCPLSLLTVGLGLLITLSLPFRSLVTPMQSKADRDSYQSKGLNPKL